MSSRLFLVLLGIAAIVGWSCVYTVTEYQRAVLEEFGKVINADVAPGIHVKAPWQNVKYFEGRNMVLDTPPTQFLTKESEYLDVDSYVIWRVANVQRFYTATRGGNLTVARDLLGSRVRDGLKNAVSERTLVDVVFGEREELVASLTNSLNEVTLNELGIEVIDVRTKRIDYPRDARENVFNRMRTDREQEARRIRAEGRELAEKIRADADRQSQEILAQGYKEAETTRGEGDALSTAVYAKAYNQDRKFYEFYRSLAAYRSAFASGEDILVLEPDSEFFRFLNQSGANK